MDSYALSMHLICSWLPEHTAAFAYVRNIQSDVNAVVADVSEFDRDFMAIHPILQHIDSVHYGIRKAPCSIPHQHAVSISGKL